MKSFILSSVILFLFQYVFAQEPYGILEGYIQMGIDNNVSLETEELNVTQSIEALREARGLFLPEISFNASYMRAQGGRNITFPVGDLINPIYQQLNSLSESSTFPTNLANEEIQFLPDNFHDTRVELRQPLFNSDVYHSYKAKKSLLSMNESKKQAYEKELIKEIKVAYYEYLRANSVKHIYLSTKELMEELLRVNRALVANHKATADVVYSAEFEVSDVNSKIAQAEKQLRLATSYFNFLLNREMDSHIEIDSNLIISTNLQGTSSYFQDLAINGRNELDQIDYASETQQHILNLQKGHKLPQISLGAQAGYQGFGYDFGKDQDYALLSLNLEFPLFTGFRNNSKIQQSKIQLKQLQLERENLENNIKLEVIQAYRSLEAARASFVAKEAAAKSAAKSFKIISRKYQEHLVLLVELLDARTKYTNSQTSLTIAKYMVMIRAAELEWAASL